MKIIFVICVIVSGLLTFPDFNEALITSTTVRYKSATPVETKGYISCLCDRRGIKTEKIPKGNFDEDFTNLIDPIFCSRYFRTEICNLVTECSTCTVIMSMCNASSNEMYNCIEKDVVIGSGYTNVSSYGSLQRVKRIPRECTFPVSLKTSGVSCAESSHSMRCTQNCIYGHTLKEGIRRNMNCNFSEDVWKPHAFEECTPFVDCTLFMTGSGKMRCRSATAYKPVQCNVTCYHFEDHPKLPMKTYDCLTTGTWSKKLPHCVAPRGALYLASAPRVKLHIQQDKLDAKKILKERMRKKKLLELRRAGVIPLKSEKLKSKSKSSHKKYLKKGLWH